MYIIKQIDIWSHKKLNAKEKWKNHEDQFSKNQMINDEIKKYLKKIKFNSCEHLKLVTIVMRWGWIAYKAKKKNNKAKISIKKISRIETEKNKWKNKEKKNLSQPR